MAAALGDAGVQRRLKAYPGSITYLDLMRRNRRQSVLLIIVMIALGVLLGAIIGAALGLYAFGAEPPPGSSRAQEMLWLFGPSALAGAAVALVAGSLGAAWSWFGGANAILRMSHAHRITRDLDAELVNVVEEMAIAAGLPTPEVYLIGDSAMNAFATGRDPRHAAVAITVGLRSRLARDELQAVIAHEMAHVRHLDIRFAMLMATMVGLIVLACDAFLRATWHGVRFGGAHARPRAGKAAGGHAAAMIALFLLAIVLAVVAPFFARVIQMSYSRRREYLADAGAVELTRNPLALASALQKLADDEEPLVDTANRGTAHMYIVNPLRRMRHSHQGLNSLLLSHPPVKERIARILALTR